MKASELAALVSGIIETHGPDSRVSFLYQTKAGRTKIGDVTGYHVFGIASPGSPTIHMLIDYPRGEVEQ